MLRKTPAQIHMLVGLAFGHHVHHRLGAFAEELLHPRRRRCVYVHQLDAHAPVLEVAAGRNFEQCET
jgi:hypothetical protein